MKRRTPTSRTEVLAWIAEHGLHLHLVSRGNHSLGRWALIFQRHRDDICDTERCVLVRPRTLRP